MNSDYEIKFKFVCEQEPETLDRLLERFIESVERANSVTGGGCSPRDGEFYVETDDDFNVKDLLTLLAVWLPHTKSLSVKAVAKEAQPSNNGRISQSRRTAKAKSNRTASKRAAKDVKKT